MEEVTNDFISGTLDPPGRSRLVHIDALRDAVRARKIDTVVVAMTDMQGRLQGKRFHAQFFLDEVAAHGRRSARTWWTTTPRWRGRSLTRTARR